MVEAGLLTRAPYDAGNRTREEYLLTAAGSDLFPVLHALAQWGERHRPAADGRRLDVVHEGCGEVTGSADTCTACGERLTRRTPSRGAVRATRRCSRRWSADQYLSSAPKKRLRVADRREHRPTRRPFYPVADTYDGRAVPLGLPDRESSASKEETTHAEQQPCLPQVGGLQRQVHGQRDELPRLRHADPDRPLQPGPPGRARLRRAVHRRPDDDRLGRAEDRHDAGPHDPGRRRDLGPDARPGHGSRRRIALPPADGGRLRRLRAVDGELLQAGDQPRASCWSTQPSRACSSVPSAR